MARPEGGYFQGGVRITSVTEALTLSRVRRWSGDPSGWERRRMIGSAVHTVTAILDCNKTTWAAAPRDWTEEYEAVDPVEVPLLVRAWEICKREVNFVPRRIEHSLFAKLRDGVTPFATTLDREGLILTGEPAIVEIKTPKVAEKYWGVQLAGQEQAQVWNEGPPRTRPYKYKRFVAQLFARERNPYHLIPYESPLDLGIFEASMVLAVWNTREYGT